MLSLLLALATLPAALSDEAIDAVLESRRPENVGSPHVIADALLDLNADKVLDRVVLYLYTIGSAQGKDGEQHLMAVISSGTD
jgi:hypothetical protein